MNEWQSHASAAQVDLQAAFKVQAVFTGTNEQTLMHLRDAAANIERAIEALEDEE